MGVQSNADRAALRLVSVDARVLEAAGRGLQRGLTWAVARSQTGYLQGPRPKRLGEVTGRLLQSITSHVFPREGAHVRGAMGTNVVMRGTMSGGLLGRCT